MVTIIFITVFILTILFLKKKRDIEKHSIKRGFSYHFYKNSLEFLIPFVIVISFYFLLSVLTLIAAEFASLQFLIWLEEFFEKIKLFFSKFKLNTIQVLIVFIVFYLLGMLMLPSKKSKKIFRLFDKYQTLTRWIYIILVLLCSFTLLGTQFGKLTTDLKVRIKTIRDGYADIYKETRESISEEATSRIYARTFNGFPLSYQNALAFPEKIKGQIDSLRDYYKSAQTEYGIKDRNIEAILSTGESHIEKASGLKSKEEIKAIKKIQFAEPDPRQISYRKVKNAKKALNQYRSSVQPKLIELLRIEGGDKIASQLPKVFTYEIKTALFKQLIKTYPILEPVIDVFARTIDKGIETEVEQVINRVTNSAIQSPENLKKMMNEEVTKIVDYKTVEIPPESLEKADQVRKQLEQEWMTISAAKTNLDQHIEQLKTDKFISQLYNEGEDVRVEAAEELAKRGDKLTNAQINRLVEIMRNGSEEWEVYVDERWEGNTCYKRFKTVSIRQYAAQALGKSNSQHLDYIVKKEAKDFFQTEKEHTTYFTRTYI